MAAVTIRNLPDATHRALKARAARNGRSTEAELRMIIADAVDPQSRLRMGDALAAIGQECGLTEDDLAVFDKVRDRTPAEPMSLE